MHTLLMEGNLGNSDRIWLTSSNAGFLNHATVDI